MQHLQGQASDDPFVSFNALGHTLVPVGLVATFIGYLPLLLAAIASAVGAIFYSIQIYESSTFQHWRVNRIMKKKARKLAKLRAKERVVVARIEALETVKTARVEAKRIVAVGQADAAKIAAHADVDTASKQNPAI